ncbi:hypothetical protein GPECTOR_21g763 [Gonium pectorale]|uniref:Aminomethyltransferase folate-binding domain-containing protein n=1 Tax=Gonium pectorale TaxID=33097 RepID=A0A150GIL9_GONPE|nr:hypothetical protein GPECTOR_21g763 [Gonium pectorale]|eukprot:KXZ49535.1 hypothetical protein GPECTOR_21g763 [Gonium pectorale]
MGPLRGLSATHAVNAAPLRLRPPYGRTGCRTTIVPSAFSIDDLQLDIPEIDGDIRSLQVEMGAIFDDAGLATTFGRKRDALTALGSGLVLADQSHWGRLRVAGEGRTELLHNQSTQDFKRLAPGQAADTEALAPVLGCPAGRHVLVGFRGRPVFVLAGSGLGPSVPGFTLVADEAVAGDLYAAFAQKGAIPMGTEDWEAARILVGRPARGAELTEAHNPLEAGLYGAVSLNKGCYIGQETLAKLHLRDGVNRQLWGLALSGPTAPGAEITSELSKIGEVTSACQDGEGEWVGLGYLRCRLQGAQLELEGVRVAVNGTPATVTSIPFATRRFSEAAEAPAAREAAAAAEAEGGDDAGLAARLEEAKRRKAEAAAEKAAATEAKLKARRDRGEESWGQGGLGRDGRHEGGGCIDKGAGCRAEDNMLGAMQERVAAWQAAQQQQTQQQQQ